jgi:integrase
MKGTITRRGKTSWRLKFDVGNDKQGKRRIRYQTVRGKRTDAERELARLLHSFNEGTSVEPSKITVAAYIRGWLDSETLAPKTLERYRQLAEQQIIPHLGISTLQKLRPAQIQDWHGALLSKGGKNDKPLSARTVGHAHRVLHRALSRACALEIVSRNVAAAVRPPKVECVEVEILSASQLAEVLARLERNNFRNEPHPMLPLVTLALGTGMRRGELLALQWSNVDLETAMLKVEHSLEETKAGLRLKSPKTKHGRRAISLPASAVEALRGHRAAQRTDRLALGLGRETPGTPVFGTAGGAFSSPDNLSRDWRRLVKSHVLPQVKFHALRHSHASALIAAGLDVVTVSRRLGHSSPTVTLTTYAHLFQKTDLTAASVIEATLRVRTSDP